MNPIDPFVESDSDNHYQAVIKAARRAQNAKAQASQDAWENQKQTYESELPGMIREEEQHRRALGR